MRAHSCYVYVHAHNNIGARPTVHAYSLRNCKSKGIFYCIISTVCPDHQYQCECGRIDGQQSPCISTEQRCDGVTDCLGGDDELEYNCPCRPEGAVRLVDGIVPYRGRLEFCMNGKWSGICSNRWDNRDASVVCRQLGYPGEGISCLLNVYYIYRYMICSVVQVTVV